MKTLDDSLDKSKKEIQDQLAESAAGVAQDIKGIQGRIDTFVSVVFTVVAVLFAGLSVVATKGSDDSSVLSSSVLVAAVALYYACLLYTSRCV